MRYSIYDEFGRSNIHEKISAKRELQHHKRDILIISVYKKDKTITKSFEETETNANRETRADIKVKD